MRNHSHSQVNGTNLSPFLRSANAIQDHEFIGALTRATLRYRYTYTHPQYQLHAAVISTPSPHPSHPTHLHNPLPHNPYTQDPCVYTHRARKNTTQVPNMPLIYLT